MSITKYKALLTTIEYGSLTKAAEELGYTQPGISHMIKSLETEFGFPLLNRHKDGVSPTENAQDLLFYLRQIVTGEEKLLESVNKIKGLGTGTIRIGCFYSVSLYWLPPIIKTFEEVYPNIQLQLFVGDYMEINAWLMDGKIDLGILSAPAPKEFEFIPLKNDPIYAVLPEDNPLCNKASVTPSELIKHPYIAPYKGSDEEMLRVLQAENLIPKIKYRVKGDETILAMVSQGLGVSLMPELFLSRIPEHLVVKKLSKEYFRTLGIAISSTQTAAPAVKKFIESITDIIK
ncbi:MAG: LysR family transcriptional regulator [Clostridium sp.]|nr:LysR family transcriptional regulator [Clostridium sp.]MDU7083181.1 LysR family transcriptional regulator [Clostridium sp.]